MINVEDADVLYIIMLFMVPYSYLPKIILSSVISHEIYFQNIKIDILIDIAVKYNNKNLI